MESTEKVNEALAHQAHVFNSSPKLDAPAEEQESALDDFELISKLDNISLEALIELKISRFLDKLGTYFPENLHSIFMQKMEKPLLHQILRRTGGNQVHAARILGINRNTLRKKMKLYGLA